MAALDDAATDLRQTIAALRRELDERTAERDEALAQQAATGEILGVISRSPADIQPVFEAIVARAARCARRSSARWPGSKTGCSTLSRSTACRRRRPRRFTSLFPRSPERNFAMGRRLCRRAAGAFRGRAGRAGLRRPHARNAPIGGEIPLVSRGTDLSRGTADRRYRLRPTRGQALHRRPRSRSSRPSPTRPRSRSRTSVCSASWRPATRGQRGAGAADRDRRGIAGYQYVARRSRAGVRGDARQGDPALRLRVQHPVDL